MERVAASLTALVILLAATAARAVEGDIATGTPVRTIVPGEAPSVAVGTANTLVVWPGNAARIWGARTTSEGRLIDTRSFPISGEDLRAPSADVGFGGGVYLVVWRALADDGATSVRARRVRASDRTLLGDEIILPAADEVSGGPAIAFDGVGTFLVSWAESTGSATRVAGARLFPDGTVGNRIAIAGAPLSSVAVAWTGSAFFVAWVDGRNVARTGRDIYGARVTRAGGVLDPGGVPVSRASRDQTDVAIAGNGSGALLVWTDLRYASSTGRDLFGTRLSAGNRILEPGGFAIVRSSLQQAQPAVAWNGGRYIVVYQHAYVHTRSVLVSASRAVGRPRVISSALGQREEPDVGSRGGVTVSAWADGRGAIFGTGLYASGAPRNSTGFAISFGSNAQSHPAAATNGDITLIVWLDSRGGFRTGVDVYAARISAAGENLDPLGIPIVRWTGDQYSPSVAWGGSRFVVTWVSAADVYSAAVTPAGGVSAPVLVSNAAGRHSSPAIAGGDGGFLVAWTSCPTEADCDTGSNFRIAGARLGATGGLIDASPLSIASGPSYRTEAALSWNGTSYVAAWLDCRLQTCDVSESNLDVFAARVTPSGGRPDGTGFLVSTGIRDVFAPAIAWDGAAHLIAWADGLGGNDPDAEIRARRVSSLGVVLDAGDIVIASDAHFQTRPAVTSNGSGFTVAWEQRGQRTDNPDPNAGISAARVAADGTVTDPGGVQQVATDGVDDHPVVVGPWLIYERYEGGRIGARRVFARAVTFP